MVSEAVAERTGGRSGGSCQPPAVPERFTITCGEMCEEEGTTEVAKELFVSGYGASVRLRQVTGIVGPDDSGMSYEAVRATGKLWFSAECIVSVRLRHVIGVADQ